MIIKIIPIIVLICFVINAQAQKTRSIPLEIPEKYPPEVLLPTPVTSLDTVIINKSGYKIGEIDVPPYTEKFESKGKESDLLLTVELLETDVKSFEVTHSISGDNDFMNYLVTATYQPNVNWRLDYQEGGWSVYRDQIVGEQTLEYRVAQSEVRMENGMYVLRNPEEFYRRINSISLNRALSNAGADRFVGEETTVYVGIYTVEDKKQDYSAVAQANELIKQGYDKYLFGDKEGAKSDLDAGAEHLRGLLDQAEYNNKKAYVNPKVAGALAGTMAFAFEFAGEYNKALEIIDIMDANQLKLPGGVYYNPEFTGIWRQRLNKKSMIPGIMRPILEPIRIEKSEFTDEGDSKFIKMDVSGYRPYSKELLQSFNDTYYNRDRVGPAAEQLLYGPDAEVLVSELYGLEDYDGLEIYDVDLNNDAISIINFGIRLNQFTTGSTIKVLRIIAPDWSYVVDVTAPDGIINDDQGFRRYVTDLTLLPGLNKYNINIRIRKEEVNPACEWLSSIPEAFPMTEFKRTVSVIKYDFEVGEGKITLQSNEVQDRDPRVALHSYKLYKMRKDGTKDDLLTALEASNAPPEVKARGKRMLKNITEDYRPTTYNSYYWEP
jgi:hypothetical protein